jgi:ChpA-C
MRPWARWTARTALVAVVSAAAGGGLSGIALAGTGGAGNSGSTTLLGGGGLLAPLNIPAEVCGDASALLGIAVAGCPGGTVASVEKTPAADGGAAQDGAAQDGAGQGGTGSSGSVSAGSGNRVHTPVSTPVDVCGNAVAVFGAASASCAGEVSTTSNGLGNSSASTVFSGTATPGPDSSALRQTFGDTLNAPGLGAGNPDNPAASQLAGLGTLPGLADLPSLTGLANQSASSGTTGSSTLMTTSALSAADASGMSSDSYAALAIGALLAGAAALKIASRRARDRKAGIGATI